MVPGMYHCGGGNAPNTFDMLAPIQDWVEKGAAPDMILATQTTNGGMSGGFANPTDSTSSGQVVRSRPLCPYPQEQTYKGSGDINDRGRLRLPDAHVAGPDRRELRLDRQ